MLYLALGGPTHWRWLGTRWKWAPSWGWTPQGSWTAPRRGHPWRVPQGPAATAAPPWEAHCRWWRAPTTTLPPRWSAPLPPWAAPLLWGPPSRARRSRWMRSCPAPPTPRSEGCRLAAPRSQRCLHTNDLQWQKFAWLYIMSKRLKIVFAMLALNICVYDLLW